MIFVGNVVTKVAIALLNPATVHGVQPAELQPVFRTGCDKRLEHMCGLISWDIKLPAQLSHVSHAVGAGQGHADLDLARSAEGMHIV